jgi:hypothetical protein
MCYASMDITLYKPPSQLVAERPSPGVKRPGREVDHSPPSSAEIKNEWSYTSFPSLRRHGMVFS